MSSTAVTWRESKGITRRAAGALLLVHVLLLVPLNTSLTLPKKPPNLVFLQGRFTWCPGVKCGPYPHGPTLSSCTRGVLGAAGLGDKDGTSHGKTGGAGGCQSSQVRALRCLCCTKHTDPATRSRGTQARVAAIRRLPHNQAARLLGCGGCGIRWPGSTIFCPRWSP